MGMIFSLILLALLSSLTLHLAFGLTPDDRRSGEPMVGIHMTASLMEVGSRGDPKMLIGIGILVPSVATQAHSKQRLYPLQQLLQRTQRQTQRLHRLQLTHLRLFLLPLQYPATVKIRDSRLKVLIQSPSVLLMALFI